MQQKSDQWLPGYKWWDYQGYEETSRSDGYVHHLDYNDGFLCTYYFKIYQIVYFKYKFFLYIDYASTKL